jgi:hypothetical protein
MMKQQTAADDDGIFEAGNGGDDDDLGEGSSGSRSSLVALEEILSKLTDRIIQTDMEDFELVGVLFL